MAKTNTANDETEEHGETYYILSTDGKRIVAIDEDQLESADGYIDPRTNELVVSRDKSKMLSFAKALHNANPANRTLFGAVAKPSPGFARDAVDIAEGFIAPASTIIDDFIPNRDLNNLSAQTIKKLGYLFDAGTIALGPIKNIGALGYQALKASGPAGRMMSEVPVIGRYSHYKNLDKLAAKEKLASDKYYSAKESLAGDIADIDQATSEYQRWYSNARLEDKKLFDKIKGIRADLQNETDEFNIAIEKLLHMRKNRTAPPGTNAKLKKLYDDRNLNIATKNAEIKEITDLFNKANPEQEALIFAKPLPKEIARSGAKDPLNQYYGRELATPEEMNRAWRVEDDILKKQGAVDNLGIKAGELANDVKALRRKGAQNAARLRSNAMRTLIPSTRTVPRISTAAINFLYGQGGDEDFLPE